MNVQEKNDYKISQFVIRNRNRSVVGFHRFLALCQDAVITFLFQTSVMQLLFDL